MLSFSDVTSSCCCPHLTNGKNSHGCLNGTRAQKGGFCHSFFLLPLSWRDFCQASRLRCVQSHTQDRQSSVDCVMWRDALRLSCVNCWHFLSRIIARSSVKKNPPTHIPPGTETGSALCSPVVTAFILRWPKSFVSDMFQIHIDGISFFGIANLFPTPLCTVNFSQAHRELVRKPTLCQVHVKACLSEAGEGWVIGCNWCNVSVLLVQHNAGSVIPVKSEKKLSSPASQVSPI